MSDSQPSRPRIPHTIRRLSVPILLFWLGLAAVTNITVPQLEEVGRTHNVALNSPDAPSLKAIKRIGQDFHEFDTDSSAMVVLEGDKPLGADAHKFYDEMVRKLEQDKKHVEHVQDFWGDTLTAAGSQSTDGKAAYVQVFLAGNQGSAIANASVGAVRDIVDHTQPPPGVKAYVTGAAPLISDQFDVGSKGTAKVTSITVGVIALMLFFVYRSILTTLLVLVHRPRRNVRRPRNRRLPGQRRGHRAVDIRDESAHAAGDCRRNGLRDIFRRPLPGSARCRRGSRKGLLHNVSRNGPYRLGFGSDRCRSGGLSELYAAALFSEPGHSGRAGHPRRACRRADPESGDAHPGRFGRHLRTQARR